MAVHSKRAAEITAETQRRGLESYAARGIVARDTRSVIPRPWPLEAENVAWETITIP